MSDYQSWTAAATGRKGRTQTLRQQRIKAGLCARCGVFPPEPKRRQCAQCRKYHQVHSRLAYKRRLEDAKDKAAKSYSDAASEPTPVRGNQWYWSFSVDMPTVFEMEVTDDNAANS